MKILTLFLGLLTAGFVSWGQTEGTLNVATSTSETGGKYAPRNVMAIWIEDDAGTFVKTLMAYGDKRRTHLNNWQKSTGNAGSEYNTTDAITGATKSNHGYRECSWDGTNFERDTVKDGNYTLCMELTDKNETGNYSTFNLLKSAEGFDLTPQDVASFSDISIIWTPVEKVGIEDVSTANLYKVYPSPTTGPLHIYGDDYSAFKIVNQNGKVVYRGNKRQLDVSNYATGIYTVVIFNKDKSFTYKFVKL